MNHRTHETCMEQPMASNEEKQWKRHIRDEANAIDAQQATAGPDHHPVPGPGRYGDHATNISVREAVLAERERCARQAALSASEPALREELGAMTERDRQVAQAVANAIVGAIRSDDTPE
jgi:hypothetical protein